jgi:hypothetical protein
MLEAAWNQIKGMFTTTCNSIMYLQFSLICMCKSKVVIGMFDKMYYYELFVAWLV